MISKRDFKYLYDDIHILYYGEWFDKTKTRMNLTRENYAQIDKKSYSEKPDIILKRWEDLKKQKETKHFEDAFIRICPLGLKYDVINNEVFLSDEYCQKYQELCLKNYDLNIKFIKNLNADDFNKKISSIVKKYKMIEIQKLYECKNQKGIYLAVLDNYKQVYIGQSVRDLRARILTHWRIKPKFDKTLVGKYDETPISYNSFGILDTTRIFVIFEENKEKIDKIEKELTMKIPLKYQTNITGGGIHWDSIDDIFEMVNTTNRRNFKENKSRRRKIFKKYK